MSGTLKLPSVLLLLPALASCSGEPSESPHRIQDAWARPMIVTPQEQGHAGGFGTAVYLSIQNTGSGLDHLVEGDTPVAEGVELHQSVLEGEVVRMRRVEKLPLPPGEVVELRPGGLHLMLRGLRTSLNPGDTFPLTLRFQAAAPSVLRVPVVGFGGG
jgi:copper(I)-binding protein